MTALCGGGASSIKPGYGPATAFTAGAIEGALIIAGLEPVAAFLGPFLAAETLELTTLCADDPPADPILTQADLVGLADPSNPVVFSNSLLRVRQWWHRQYWCIACKCDSGITPNCGAPSNPGPIGQSDGLPSGSTGVACWEASPSFNVPVPTASSPPAVNCNSMFPGTATTAIIPSFGGQSTVAKVMPTGAKTITVHMHGSGTAPGPTGYLNFFDATGHAISPQLLFDFTSDSGSNVTFGYANISVPATAASWQCEISPYFNTPTVVQGSTWSISWDFSYTCSSSQNTPATPCCPPDPTLDYKLTNIYNLLLALHSGGGTAPPTAWRDGIRHTGLGDHGHFALAPGAVGVRAEVISLPATSPGHPGDPIYYYDLGFITPMAIDVPLRGQRLLFNPQSFALPQFADGIAYTFLHGTQANLVELLPVTSP